MSLWSRLVQTVRSVWRRRDGLSTSKRARVGLEHLDHRQLLSVNFTGNVITDFPANQQGIVFLNPANVATDPAFSNATVTDPALAALVKVSGFNISGIRLAYDPTFDRLQVGIQQPPSQQVGQPGPVIAGDADNNGNSAVLSPAAAALGMVADNANLGGTENMGIFLDFNQDKVPDVAAGVATNNPAINLTGNKDYQVASSGNFTPPNNVFFTTSFPQFTGAHYLVNSPVAPNFEFNINNFSQLYLQETGKSLTPDARFNVRRLAGRRPGHRDVRSRTAGSVPRPDPAESLPAAGAQGPDQPALAPPHEHGASHEDPGEHPGFRAVRREHDHPEHGPARRGGADQLLQDAD
jgi:hypothetical protein